MILERVRPNAGHSLLGGNHTCEHDAHVENARSSSTMCDLADRARFPHSLDPPRLAAPAAPISAPAQMFTGATTSRDLFLGWFWAASTGQSPRPRSAFVRRSACRDISHLTARDRSVVLGEPWAALRRAAVCDATQHHYIQPRRAPHRAARRNLIHHHVRGAARPTSTLHSTSTPAPTSPSPGRPRRR
jgi:hypothetical protein